MKKLPKCANGQIFDHFYSVSECEATRRKTNSSVSKHTHTGIERARGGRRQKTIFTKIVFLFIIGLVAMSATLISDFVERIFRRNFFSRFRFLLLSLLLFFFVAFAAFGWRFDMRSATQHNRHRQSLAAKMPDGEQHTRQPLWGSAFTTRPEFENDYYPKHNSRSRISK